MSWRSVSLRWASVGRLVKGDHLDRADGPITLADVTEARMGQRFAFIMDTAPCDVASTSVPRT
jgi:hypothetical protein